MSVYGGNFRNVNNIRQAGGADIPPCIEEKKMTAPKMGMFGGIFPKGID